MSTRLSAESTVYELAMLKTMSLGESINQGGDDQFSGSDQRPLPDLVQIAVCACTGNAPTNIITSQGTQASSSLPQSVLFMRADAGFDFMKALLQSIDCGAGNYG